MKNSFLMIVLLNAILVSNLFSQDKIKFGNVPMEEIENMTYEADSEASAVVLFEEKYTHYDFATHGLFVNNDYVVRIKILTNEGMEYANAEVSRYIGRTNADSDVLSGLTGYTHNIENGKVERTKLSKEHIFEEKVSDHRMRTKFALPKVRAGSVIEYKYSIRSPHYGDLDDFVFQREIPVQYSKYTLRIPEYFRFNKQVRGVGSVKHEPTTLSETFFIGGNSLNCNSEQLVFEVRNLEALKAEKYVWCPRDYMTKVTFELRGIQIPGALYKSFTNTWENVDKQLSDSENFGKQFGHKLFKEELAALLTPGMDDTDKVRAVYNLVRSKVKCDDTRTLWAKSPKNALKKGVGTSAEVNALLICALKEAGFNAFPVAMSLRGRGRVSVAHPTIDHLNYFIVRVDIDGNPVYMDASSRYGDLNVLPVDCLVDFARNIGGGIPSQWLHLSRLNQSSEQMLVNASFNEEGLLTGDCKQVFTNQMAYSFRQRYGEKKDEQSFIDELQNASNIQIADFKVENLDETDKRVGVSYSFVKNDLGLQDDFTYINPLVFPEFTSSPFKAENRVLPVEFAFPYKVRMIATLALPAGYVVEELPKPNKVSLKENDIEYLYNIQYDEDTHKVSVRFEYTLSNIIYLQNDYELLRDFYTHLASQTASLITLRKGTGLAVEQ